ncbi:MAG: DUF3048 domain-containing protein [Patescibacteria group bacterium]|jgi:hypothetical protein
MNPKALKILAYLGTYFILTGISYFVFTTYFPAKSAIISPNTESENQQQTPKKAGIITFEGPKTEVCPINGQLFTADEREIWETRRPLLAMIENHKDSRPQSGLNNADIVYEAIAEGGITRFMAVFYCNALSGAPNKYDIGPVRSARTYFLDLASEYGDYPLYTHVGGANCSPIKNPDGTLGACTTDKRAQAIEQIASYGWNNKGTWSDLSQFSLPYKVCRREESRTGEVKATEHTVYCSTTELWNVAAQRGLTNMTEAKGNSWDEDFRSWSFKQKDQASSSPTAKTISFAFTGGYNDYAVEWQYDSLNNAYLRYNGGSEAKDFNLDETITAKNIVVQYVKETRSVDEHKHNLYGVIGSGSGIMFQNGEKIDITWSKINRTARTIFKDKAGKEINFVPGITWVEILPLNTDINYENN